ncbi:MAG: glycosyltransferase family 2 protein [Flavobacteriaceae bacterium]|nr:glycosyltransferase family 2 protein [Flavobacteriaceae bacterium]
MKTLTVFTPTYNRAYCLYKCYESLKRQTSDDFIWLIVDDGSTDNTAELVKVWKNESNFKIEYYYKENGGMHTAHNEAYKNIVTELNVCIDSDDYMPDNAVELIISRWRKDGAKKYAGLLGLDIDTKGNRIAKKAFPQELHSCKYMDLKKYGVIGDIKFVYRTDVIKEYMPYPVFEGENYLSVGYVYAQIDLKFDMLCSNDVYCIVEYMPDGISKNKLLQYKKYPKGFAHIRKIMMVISLTFFDRFKSAMHYVSSSIFLKNRNFIKESPNKILTVFALPFGVLLHLYIIYLNKKNK